MLVRRCELRDEPDALFSAGHCRMALRKDGVTLDIAAWPLHKNDIQDLRWVVFF